MPSNTKRSTEKDPWLRSSNRNGVCSFSRTERRVVSVVSLSVLSVCQCVSVSVLSVNKITWLISDGPPQQHTDLGVKSAAL